jgi:protein-tyrosine phosphatase
LPPGPLPTVAVHLTGRCPPQSPCDRYWLRWRDFWLPSDFGAAQRTLRLAYERSATERVEIACGWGVGRTGTGIAALAVLDGMDPGAAVAWVRRHYHPRAVEVPWQRLFLRVIARER